MGEIIHRVFYWDVKRFLKEWTTLCMWEEAESRLCIRGRQQNSALPCFTQAIKSHHLNKHISNTPRWLLCRATLVRSSLVTKWCLLFWQFCHGDFQSGVHGEDPTMIYLSSKGIHNSLALHWTLFSAVLGGDGMFLWGRAKGWTLHRVDRLYFKSEKLTLTLWIWCKLLSWLSRDTEI